VTKGLTRREALASIGALVTGPRLLGGCGGGAEKGRITTVVTLMMENRSYDHYLGSRALEGKPGDGLAPGMSNPDTAGVARPSYHETVDCIADPPHGWMPSRTQFDGGANDGFVRAYQTAHGADAPPYPMGYFTRADLPAIHGLADGYTVFDRWFASLLGPTWPNRLYLHAAQSGGAITNDPPPGGKFTFPTIYDRLDAAGIEWVYYYSDVPFLGVLDRVPAERMKLIDHRFFDDAAGGKLPSYVVIDPGFLKNDDHPPHHPLLGQQFIATIYAALAAAPQWNEMLFTLVYDEHGGFFDHVRPPTAPDDRAADGFGQLGFRVPALVIGPYARRATVSSVMHEHTSVLRHLENLHGLPHLTMRDAAATDLSDGLDLDRLARAEPLPPVAIPAIEVDESMIDQSCFFMSEANELVRALDARGPWAELDGRARWRDQLHLYGEVLDRFGAGRVRRGR
jgi:phospholipase C